MSVDENRVREIVRETVREELRALLLGQAGHQTVFPEPRAAVVKFLETLKPGERVKARTLWERWAVWSRLEAPALCGMTIQAFGRIAARSGRVRRSVGSGTRFYVRTSVGAP